MNLKTQLLEKELNSTRKERDSLLERAKALEIALGICSTNLSEARDDIDNMSLNSRRRLKKARAIWLFYTDKLILEQEQEYFRHASVLDKEKKRMDRTQEFLRAKVVRIESLEKRDLAHVEFGCSWLIVPSGSWLLRPPASTRFSRAQRHFNLDAEALSSVSLRQER